MKLFYLFLLLTIGLLVKAQPNDKVLSIYVDEHGIVWCGTETGMLKKVGDTWTSFTAIDDITLGRVNSLAPQFTKYGSEFWAATSNGATVASYDVDGITGSTSYTFESSDIASNNIKHVMLDENDFRYFATDSGLSIFAGDTFLIVKDLEDMGKNNSYNASAASNDTIFIASNRGVGRVVYNGVDGFTGATTWQFPFQSGLPSDSITSIYISKDYSQWYGTDAGIAKHIGYKGKDDWVLTLGTSELDNAYINVIAEDSANNIWLGTNGGLVKLDYDIDDENYASKIATFTTADGLPSNVINAIYVVDDSNMWVGTDLGPYLISKNSQVTEIKSNFSNLGTLSVYPNPFINKLTIDFKEIQSQKLVIKVYSITGKLIDTPFNGFVYPNYKVVLSMEQSKAYASGTYIIKIEAEHFSRTMRIQKR